MAIGVQVWSQVASQNSSSDTNINFAEGQAPSSLNDSCRAVMASVAKWRDDNNGTLVTGGSTTAFTVATNQIEGALTAGYTLCLQFHATADTAATLNVDSLGAKQIQIVPGTNLTGQEIQAATIHKLTYQTSSTAWVVQDYIKTNSLASTFSSDVAISASVFTDGPFVTNPTAGTWFASGQVTLNDAGTAAQYELKLWDGTTVFASCIANQAAANAPMVISLSGAISAPAGNIKISAKETVGSAGNFKNNLSGGGKDCVLTAVRLS